MHQGSNEQMSGSPSFLLLAVTVAVAVAVAAAVAPVVLVYRSIGFRVQSGGTENAHVFSFNIKQTRIKRTDWLLHLCRSIRAPNVLPF